MSVNFEKLKFILDERFLEVIDDIVKKRKQYSMARELKDWRQATIESLNGSMEQFEEYSIFKDYFKREKVVGKDFDECSVISTTFSSSKGKIIEKDLDECSVISTIIFPSKSGENNSSNVSLIKSVSNLEENGNEEVQNLKNEILKLTENNQKLHKFNRNLKNKVERCYQIISIKSEEIMKRGRMLKSLNLNENFFTFYNELQKREKMIAENLKEIRRKEKIIVQYQGNEKHYQNLTADCTRKINLLKEKIENLGFKVKEDKLHNWSIVKLNEEVAEVNRICKEIVKENVVNENVNLIKNDSKISKQKEKKSEKCELKLKECQLKQKEEEINKREQELIKAKTQEEKYVSNLMDKLTKEITEIGRKDNSTPILKWNNLQSQAYAICEFYDKMGKRSIPSKVQYWKKEIEKEMAKMKANNECFRHKDISTLNYFKC